MSLNGISAGYSPRSQPPVSRPVVTDHKSPVAPGAHPIDVGTQRPVLRAPAGAPGAPALSAEAPAGTDPALWSILSAEERSYFAKSQAMGPLTYGRRMAERAATSVPAVRGGRLDIRG
ncbi:hypothetical protein BH11GEM2_BH11GEM2_09850 [soil metagenome]